ncbi:glycosyltransferase [Antarcticirhabdus aurantiaca]|uniref:Glycosyltransferase n=1 Tax=Antarcticirhabdus aurantiaca TaxID=2606717 RepID=A0ACD4NL04_9HYPH|nr:glycosyltransferase [Antarcticirhabdus aurantiaca]WAJ27478.1 glycosyltransferase [Jeongeuplla avenae]
MTPSEAWQDLPLDDRGRHAEALVLAATRLLRAGQAARAFELADHRCRLAEPPGPADRAIRALAGRLCGWPLWRAELDRALDADPLDPVASSALLRLGEAADRHAAALRLLDSPEAQAAQVEDALAHLFRSGERGVLRLDLVDGRLTGWAAWADGDGSTPVLEIHGPAGPDRLRLATDAADPLPFLPPGSAGARIDARLDAESARTARLRLGNAAVADCPLHPRSRRGERAPAAPLHAPSEIPARAPLVVVVPVFADFEATQDCLRAAVAETEGRPNRRLVVVDDASPDPKLKLLLDALAGRGMIELKRSARNLGFAGAVRRGLEDAGRADILLLNADALLPPGAIDRLAGAAYAEADIGTVTPLSNNGEYASFPAPGSDAPSPGLAARIDETAARVNDGRLVDMPTGTGFCLFVRHDCRAAVGGLPGIYGRGYFEDMELCLRAREHGFRNVCAPSVFVIHHGSRSFGAEKAVLVARNLRVLRTRFPGIETECATFVAADPLASARQAIADALRAPTRLPEPEPPEPGPAPEALAYPPDAPLSLGLVSPAPSGAADALAAALSAALRRRRPDARLVLLGHFLDDLALIGRGNVIVAGPLDGGSDDAFRLALLGLRALVLPPGAPDPQGFARLCRRFGLPGAAAGADATDPDLFIPEPNAHDTGHALAIVDWFAGRCPP